MHGRRENRPPALGLAINVGSLTIIRSGGIFTAFALYRRDTMVRRLPVDEASLWRDP